MAIKLPYKSDGQVTKPAVVKKYGNGKIPRDVLVPCGMGNHRLAEPAARAARAMVTAAAADGIALGASDSYRTYDVQLNGFKTRYTTTPIANTSKKVWKGKTYWLKRNQAMAATPGTSNHGWGVALDLAQADGNPKIQKTMWLNWKSLNWLAANGPSFGFWNSVKSEAWHWAYFPGDDIPAAVLEMERTGKVRKPKSTPAVPVPKTAKARAAHYLAVPYTSELKTGSEGVEVEAAQWALTEAGFPAKIDGDFGDKTTKAVKKFQGSKSLKVDGRVGKNTWGALGLSGGTKKAVAKKAPAKKSAAKKAPAKKAAVKKAPVKKAAAKKAGAAGASTYEITTDDADGFIAIVGRCLGLTAAPYSLRLSAATTVAENNGATLEKVWHPGTGVEFPSSVAGVRSHTVKSGQDLIAVTRALGLGRSAGAQSAVAAINSWQGETPDAGATWFGGPDE